MAEPRTQGRRSRPICGSLTVAERAAWAALALAAVVLPLFRAQPVHVEQHCGEDAWIYLPDTIQDGTLATLFRGNGGYTHLPDRLLAAPVAFLPIEWAAPYYAVVATLVAAAVGLFTAYLARAWIPSRLLRAVLVMGMVLTPVAANDLTANVVNVVWVYAAALPFVLASMEERTRDVIGRSVLAFAAATGAIVSVVFIPLALGWAIYRRTRAAITVVAAFGVGLLIQLVASRFTESATLLPPQRSLVDLSQLVEARVFAAPARRRAPGRCLVAGPRAAVPPRGHGGHARRAVARRDGGRMPPAALSAGSWSSTRSP